MYYYWKAQLKLDVVVHARKIRIWEAKRTGSEVQDQPGLHSKFQSTQDYMVRPFLKKPEQNKAYGDIITATH